ncbi:MAG: hypothetical protein IPK16_32900 [Anaerolineales bacterium]|nr:hypothetical protein [Anaerolineales bacterium]
MESKLLNNLEAVIAPPAQNCTMPAAYIIAIEPGSKKPYASLALPLKYRHFGK